MNNGLNNVLKEYAKELGFIFMDTYVMVQKPIKEIFLKATGIDNNLTKTFNIKYFVEYKVISDEFYYIIWKNDKMIYANYSYFYMSDEKECFYPKFLNDVRLIGRLKRPLFFNIRHIGFKKVKNEVYSFIQNKHDKRR